jgi:multimeric flavodoxin WrbA
MRITILNGEPDPDSDFEDSVRRVSARFEQLGHQVSLIRLRNLNLKGCSGCWGCWVKTPGECVKRDDSAAVCREALHAELVLLASPMVMGFTSALLKRTVDQMIPLVHPYFLVEGREFHHRPRYAKHPSLGLLLGAGDDTDSEDIEITTGIWKRTARNLKFKFVFTAVLEPGSNRTAEEVADELTAAA